MNNIINLRTSNTKENQKLRRDN